MARGTRTVLYAKQLCQSRSPRRRSSWSSVWGSRAGIPLDQQRRLYVAFLVETNINLNQTCSSIVGIVHLQVYSMLLTTQGHRVLARGGLEGHRGQPGPRPAGIQRRKKSTECPPTQLFFAEKLAVGRGGVLGLHLARRAPSRVHRAGQRMRICEPRRPQI